MAINCEKFVSIIIVTFNQLSYTKRCIESIFKYSNYENMEIIVVDNNSLDGTKEYLSSLGNKVKVIFNEKNLGFSKANNMGIKLAVGDVIILLNNDTVVTKGWIGKLVKHIYDNYRIGMIGPVTNNIGNESKINVDYDDIESMQEFAVSYCEKHKGELYYDIDMLAMFCVAIRKEVIEEVGFLDEKYGIGMFEDDDYSERISAAGYVLACAEDVFIHHYGNVSFNKLSGTKYKHIFSKNKKIFENKFNKKWYPMKTRTMRENMKVNTKKISSSIKDLSNNFKFINKNIIIVSGGKSLYNNIDKMKLLSKSYKLIVISSIAKVLYDNGIIPDLIISINEQESAFTQIEMYSNLKVPVCLLYTANSNITQKYLGKKYIFFSNKNDIRNSDDILIEGNSITEYALSIAIELKPKRIAFIGQDLIVDNLPDTNEKMFFSNRVDGTSATTTKNFLKIKNIIEKTIIKNYEIEFVNFSNGLKIEGCKNYSIAKIIK